MDHAQDISRTATWSNIYTEAASLYPQLEAEVLNCRSSGSELNFSVSLLAKIRALGATYFTRDLLPILPLLGTPPLELQAQTTICVFGQALFQR